MYEESCENVKKLEKLGRDCAHPGPAAMVNRIRILLIEKQPEHVISTPGVQFDLAEEPIEAVEHSSLNFISTELAENLEADPFKELDPKIFSLHKEVCYLMLERFCLSLTDI